MPNENLRTDLSITAEINLYYDVFVPDGATREAPLLIAVHGYGAHKRYMMREARLVVPDEWVIASVQGPHQHYRPIDGGYRIGFGWLTDNKPEEYVRLHHHFINEVIDRLSGDGTIDRERVIIYGFSQACALDFRYAFTYPDRLRGLVGVCGGAPGDLETNEAYRTFDADAFYLYGTDDEFYTQEQFRDFDKRLSGRIANYRSKQYEAKHEITEEMRTDIREFLSQFA